VKGCALAVWLVGEGMWNLEVNSLVVWNCGIGSKDPDCLGSLAKLSKLVYPTFLLYGHLFRKN
jgi:hypothetical protein